MLCEDRFLVTYCELETTGYEIAVDSWEILFRNLTKCVKKKSWKPDAEKRRSNNVLSEQKFQSYCLN
jgi:hypothetical protein